MIKYERIAVYIEGKPFEGREREKKYVYSECHGMVMVKRGEKKRLEQNA